MLRLLGLSLAIAWASWALGGFDGSSAWAEDSAAMRSGGSAPSPTSLQAAQLRSVCAPCHARPGSGAPLMGDAAAWAPRLEVGFEVLVARTVDGYRTMPPLGTCGSCGEADFRVLVSAVSGLPDPEASQ